MSRSGLCALSVAICLVSSAAAAGHFTTFTVPGATDTQATAINAVGTVTGFYSVHGQKQGFVRATDGTITTFAAPGLADVVPTSINAAGWIAGYAGSGQSFLRYPDGSTQVFHVKGARYTTATTINVSGYISGTYTNADNTGGSFLRDPVYRDISLVTVSNDKQTSVYGMNYGERMVGQIGFGAQSQGFITGGGSPTILGLGTSVTAINDSGWAAGVIAGANDTSRAFRLNLHRRVLPFGPKVSEVHVTCLEPLGFVTGYYLDKLSHYRGFIFGGGFKRIDAPDAGKRTPFSGTKVMGMNAAGTAAGVSISNNYHTTSFIWTP